MDQYVIVTFPEDGRTVFVDGTACGATNQVMIVQRGTHRELLLQEGMYRDLYLMQYRRETKKVDAVPEELEAVSAS